MQTTTALPINHENLRRAGEGFAAMFRKAGAPFDPPVTLAELCSSPPKKP